MKLKIYIHIMVIQKNIHVKIVKQNKSTIKSLMNLKKKFKYSWILSNMAKNLPLLVKYVTMKIKTCKL